MKKTELIELTLLLVSAVILGYTLGAKGLPFTNSNPPDVPSITISKPAPFLFNHAYVIDLETADSRVYRAEQVVDENNFGPFPEEYFVFEGCESNEGCELIRKKMEGKSIAQFLSASSHHIEQVSVTDKQVLIWIKRPNLPQP